MLAARLSQTDIPAHCEAASICPETRTAHNASEILPLNSIQTGCAPDDKEAVIRRAGQMLVDSGCVDADYIPSMISARNPRPISETVSPSPTALRRQRLKSSEPAYRSSLPRRHSLGRRHCKGRDRHCRSGR